MKYDDLKASMAAARRAQTSAAQRRLRKADLAVELSRSAWRDDREYQHLLDQAQDALHAARQRVARVAEAAEKIG